MKCSYFAIQIVPSLEVLEYSKQGYTRHREVGCYKTQHGQIGAGLSRHSPEMTIQDMPRYIEGVLMIILRVIKHLEMQGLRLPYHTALIASHLLRHTP